MNDVFPHDGRLLALGDIHGCYLALTTLVEQVALTPADRIIALGDYVDRGSDSRSVIEWLIARRAEGRLIALRGNHDLMMMAARCSLSQAALWLNYGGDATLASYRSTDGKGGLETVPQEHWDFLELGCVDFFETERQIFVHATCAPDKPLDQQTPASLFWDKLDDPQPHQSGKTVICGHTAQKNGEPKNFGHTICIDTWVYGSGWLTCLDVASGRYWQANEQGQSREGQLG
jgi:serine/threonine protein phosphatase 1